MFGAGIKALLLLTDQYAVKIPKSKTHLGRRPTMATRSEQLLQLLSEHRYSIYVYGHTIQAVVQWLEQRIYDMDAGGADENYEGGDKNDEGSEDDS